MPATATTSLQVTDAQRKRWEDALYASLLLIYAGARRQAMRALGWFGEPIVNAQEKAALRAFAAEQSVLDQVGINIRIRAVLQTVEHPDEADALLTSLRSEFEQYFSGAKAPYLASKAYHDGVIDTYANTPSPNGGNMRDAVQWQWEQFSSNQDDCTDAMNASPASFDTLTGIAGGSPPIHPRCQCSLSPV